MSATLLVAEIFGPTFQGEGPSAGQQAAFVRLSRCNLTCQWCDTPYTWDWRRFDPAKEATRLSIEQITKELDAIDAPIVVITGGEPLLQQHSLEPLIETCRQAGRAIELETNGTIAPSPALLISVTRFNVSPKLANSGIPRSRRIRPEALRTLAASGTAVFKFVVEDTTDLQEITALQREFGLTSVWVMPQGDDPDRVLAVMRAVATDVLSGGWNLTSRLHVLLWGDVRGR